MRWLRPGDRGAARRNAGICVDDGREAALPPLIAVGTTALGRSFALLSECPRRWGPLCHASRGAGPERCADYTRRVYRSKGPAQ